MMAVDPSRWRDLGSLLRNLFIYDSVRPFVIVVVAVALARVPAFGVPAWARRFGLVAVALSLFVWIVPLRVGDFSLWAGITAVVPGTSIVRDPKRVIYIYELVAAVVAGVLTAQVRVRPAWFRTVLVAASLVVLAADWHSRTFGFHRAREVYDHWVTRDIAIDPSCRSFFILPASEAYMARSDNWWVLYGMDAAFVSLQSGVPTLNGYSAWAPRGWRLEHPPNPDYFVGVREWVARHQLANVCAFDTERRTMRPFR
jgi:hypothetical protein